MQACTAWRPDRTFPVGAASLAPIDKKAEDEAVFTDVRTGGWWPADMAACVCAVRVRRASGAETIPSGVAAVHLGRPTALRVMGRVALLFDNMARIGGVQLQSSYRVASSVALFAGNMAKQMAKFRNVWPTTSVLLPFPSQRLTRHG